jgi:integrase
MLMLAAKLGIRSSDISGMVFQDIKWADNKIEFIQQKTGKAISLPLVNDVGDAIIDYLKVRPHADTKHVFVRMQPPYSRLYSGSLYGITRNYMSRADVHIPPGKKRGPHSLRHSLSSRLLECSVPLPVISEILSHSSSDITKVYLRIDISQLRECALPVPLLQFAQQGCDGQ